MLLLAAPAKCVQCQQISRVLMGVVSGVNRGYVLAHCGGGAGGTLGSESMKVAYELVYRLFYFNWLRILPETDWHHY